MLALDPDRFDQFLDSTRNAPIFELNERSSDADWGALISLESFEKHFAGPGGPVNAFGRTCRIIAGLSGDDAVNAFASSRDDFHYIAMNKGLVREAHRLSVFCFRQPFVFPGIGTLLGRLKPSWDTRDRVADFVTLLMLRFAWLHEAGHCRCGHIDYLNSLAGADDVSCELGLIELGGEVSLDAKERQFLEIEADFSALYESLQLQLHGFENLPVPPELLSSEIIQLTLFAGYAVSWLQETHKPIDPTDTHPRPYGRLRALYLAIGMKMAPQYPHFAWLNNFAMQQLSWIDKRLTNKWMHDADDTIDNYNAVAKSMLERLAPYRYGLMV